MYQGETEKQFNPNGPGLENGQLFGLPYLLEQAEVVVIPVPWDVTVSYGKGTSAGPQAILDASLQVDLYDSFNPNGWQNGIVLLDIPEHLIALNTRMRGIAEQLIDLTSKGKESEIDALSLLEIDAACEEMNLWVEQQAQQILSTAKVPVVLGGDHSSPLGLLRALSTTVGEFGILQIDAHMDLREAYEGFTYSHASIMYNALELTAVKKLVQVGIRDYCHEEMHRVKEAEKRIQVFFDRSLSRQRFQGLNWAQQVEKIIAELPSKVYISFDIDGLDPSLCPNTGTPVPGGPGFEESLFLIDQLVESGREIIGFDLCEVAPGRDEWDANVGARVLYRLFNAALLSRT